MAVRRSRRQDRPRDVSRARTAVRVRRPSTPAADERIEHWRAEVGRGRAAGAGAAHRPHVTLAAARVTNPVEVVALGAARLAARHQPVPLRVHRSRHDPARRAVAPPGAVARPWPRCSATRTTRCAAAGWPAAFGDPKRARPVGRALHARHPAAEAVARDRLLRRDVEPIPATGRGARRARSWAAAAISSTCRSPGERAERQWADRLPPGDATCSMAPSSVAGAAERRVSESAAVRPTVLHARGARRVAGSQQHGITVEACGRRRRPCPATSATSRAAVPTSGLPRQRLGPVEVVCRIALQLARSTRPRARISAQAAAGAATGGAESEAGGSVHAGRLARCRTAGQRPRCRQHHDERGRGGGGLAPRPARFTSWRERRRSTARR